MTQGLSLAELEAHDVHVLPARTTMSLIEIGSLSLLNGVNILNNNNIGAIANVRPTATRTASSSTTAPTIWSPAWWDLPSQARTRATTSTGRLKKL